MKSEDEAIRDFRLYFPTIEAKTIEYRYIEPYFELIAKLDDGTTVVFDCLDKTIRNLPKDSNAMTEEECRRELGLKLRKIMIFKGLSQKDLSEATGITECMIRNYIRGKATPSFYFIDKIAKALGCSTDDLRYLNF